MLKKLLYLLAVLGIATPASANEFDLQRWLDAPGVKLVAVEFYADWCVPCKQAAPKWEALRQKYADQGLVLVVVDMGHRSDGSGRCAALPWSPDHVLCNPSLGETFGVDALPEAFVWSWQGNLLVDRGKHIDEIDAIIRRYLNDNPRVAVEATDAKGKPDKALKRLVESELSRSGKLTVVADQASRKKLAELRRESRQAGRRVDQRCSIGAEVSANSLVQVEQLNDRLAVSLVDASSGCQRASSTARFDPNRPEQAAAKTVHDLIGQLKRDRLQSPSGLQKPTARPAPMRMSPQQPIMSGPMAAERMAPTQPQRSLRDPEIEIPDGEPDADGPLDLEALTLSECEAQKAQAWGYLLWDFLLPPLSPFMVGFGVGVPGSQFDYASKSQRTTAAIIKGIGWAMPFIGIGAIFAHASDVNSDPERAANGLDDGIIIAGAARSIAGPRI